MRIWGLLIFLLILVLLKVYLIRGVWQASDHRAITWTYGIISLGSLLLGFITFRLAFSGEQTNMLLWQNIITAFMVSVIVCELIMAVFFLIDDIAWAVQAIAEKTRLLENSTASGRRRWLKTVGLGITAIPFTAYLYGITKGKYDYKVFEKTLSFPDLPAAFDGFRIAQFSDFHAGSFDQASAVRAGLQKLQAQGADLILFTGDLVNDDPEEVLPYKDFLKELQAPFGKYAVLGNHDYPRNEDNTKTPDGRSAKVSQVIQHHQDADFQLLNNSNVKIEKASDSIHLIGVENWGTRFVKHGDLNKATEGCPDDAFSILLSHDPSHWEEEALPFPKKFHLTLAGHTHGLQMGIELPNFKWSPIKYVYPRWAGLYQEQDQYLYVNRGFGFIGFAGRVGIRPEISVFTLRKG
ncbi:MAG TPA: metallophosphoesterase [Saprospiraceae bacterium]|nr:metallophosphoesterase [Saprospiraceae bacterium]